MSKSIETSAEAPYKRLTILQFLRLLPGIDMPRARDLLCSPESPFGFGVSSLNQETVTINQHTVHREDLVSIAIDGKVDSTAALTILVMYEQAALPMKAGRMPGEARDAHLYQLASLREETLERERQAAASLARRQEVERYRAQIADPTLVREDEFSIGLLNDIFFRHHGPGGGTLTIGGLKVTKSHPVRYASNSGKSSFWSYTYSWTSPDGTPRQLDQRSAFEDNRRNDPNRNWGLPE